MVSPTNNQLAAALVQAGAFILQSEDLSGYLTLFKKNRVNLLSKKPAQSYDGYSLSVFTTWQISFKKLSQLAAIFLQLCLFLHWDGISEDIFSGASRYSFPSWGPPKENLQKALEFLSHFVVPSGEWNTFDFVKVTNEIKAYSLINFNAEKKSFSIHPLMHEWSRTTVADLNSTHLCMIDIVGMSIGEIPRKDTQLASLRLVSHVHSLMQAVPKEISRFGLQYAAIYYYAGRSTEAMKLEINTLEKRGEILGDDHPETLTVMNNLASTYQSLGQIQDAEQLQLVVLERRRKILGAEHINTLTAMNNLAITYQSLSPFEDAENLLGQFEDAEQLELVVLEKRRKILSDEHPQTLTAMNNLAGTYYCLGQFEDAEKLQLVVLEKRREILNAEKLQVVVLEKRRKILSDNHPDTVTAIINLANTYYSVAQFEDTEKLQLVVLEKQ
ncbi:hypothetical protein K438DRAFT_1783749 [Mycena galopus ATCC 62051]|nr:hypothetical protein K438DRAFT_1783749 [Mycena galopus ATCC 62051]